MVHNDESGDYEEDVDSARPEVALASAVSPGLTCASLFEESGEMKEHDQRCSNSPEGLYAG
jgi:hypothetical protein